MGMQTATVGNSIPHGNRINLQKKKADILDQFSVFLPGNQEIPEEEAVFLHSIRNNFVQINQNFNKRLKFIIDYQSNEVIVKVIDRETDKVIKVLPPEELQRLNRKIKETIGFLVDENV
jgi:flagellar protein FlaG